MANWKKVVVSGSNVSQLNNDAGYITSVTAQHAFTTASYNGTNLLADSAQGTLNFASSSGQGLTISANAGSDTLTFGLSAIPNTSLANSSITIAGTSVSLGGSITQATILAGSGVWSGSAQLPAGIVSGSSQIDGANIQNNTVSFGGVSVALGGSDASPAFDLQDATNYPYSSLTGIPSNIVSSSVLSSPGQGQAVLTINGVAGSTVDLGLETGDSPTFAGVTAGNITIGVTNDNTIGVTGNLTIDTSGNTVTINDNVVVSNNLTVQGTASFQNTTNLEVADRFILMASGSNTTGDGGIVVQQATQNIGELFGWDSASSRWGVTGSFSANTSAYTPDAYMAAVVTAAGTTPSPATRYNAVGNIYVSSGDESIWIYS